MGFGVQGLGGWGLSDRVWSLGFGVWGFGIGVWGFGVWGLGSEGVVFRVSSVVFRFSDFGGRMQGLPAQHSTACGCRVQGVGCRV